MKLRAAAVALGISLLGAAPGQLDSQYVLQRYALAVATVPIPKVVVYSYTVSQVGASNIEQKHTIYRSGSAVRDETLSEARRLGFEVSSPDDYVGPVDVLIDRALALRDR